MMFENLVVVTACMAMVASASGSSQTGSDARASRGRLSLPQPKFKSEVSLERALHDRRSVRRFARGTPLTLAEVSQLLWAVQGITDPEGFRTAPSAGALYPLEVYVVSGNVTDLAAGVYKYRPQGHQLECLAEGDKRDILGGAALGQEAVAHAPMTLVMSAVPARTTGKYGNRGMRYIHFEAGHAAQNLCLQAVSLGLGSVPVGAFHDADLKKILGLPVGEEPLYLIPVGRP